VDLSAGLLLGHDLGQLLLESGPGGSLARQGPQGMLKIAAVAGQLERGQGVQRVRRLRGAHLGGSFRSGGLISLSNVPGPG
jgi:hypothetical protein